jgi:hypothetical protein
LEQNLKIGICNIGTGNDNEDEGNHLHTMCAVESDTSGSGKGKDISSRGVEDVDGDNGACYFFPDRGTKGLNQNWLLLDSQSLTDMFCNCDYLTNTNAAARLTTIHCNAGSTVCTKEGFFLLRSLGRSPRV